MEFDYLATDISNPFFAGYAFECEKGNEADEPQNEDKKMPTDPFSDEQELAGLELKD